jgi:hypothetical protein
LKKLEREIKTIEENEERSKKLNQQVAERAKKLFRD